MRSSFPLRSASTAIAVILLSACADLTPVRRYADDTKAFTQAFHPMLAGSVDSCAAKFNRKKMLTSRGFDPAATEQAARELCGPIEEDNKVIADLNTLLGQYAQTLGNLALEQPASYKKELDGLKDSLGKVKRADSKQPLVSSSQAGAIATLTGFLSQAATQHMRRDGVRTLLDHEEAVKAITDALRNYATLNYRAYLQDEKAEMAVLRQYLDEASKTEPLAARYIEAQLRTEEKAIEARNRSIDSLVQSIDALQASHAALRAKLDQLSNRELLEQLARFGQEVSQLQRQVSSAF